MPPVNFVKDGRVITLADPSDIANAYDQGWRPETPSEHVGDVASELRSERYGGPAGKVVAAGAGVLRTVTGGVSDVALGALGGTRDLRALREENPIPSTVGEIGGALLPMGASALATRAGRSVAALGAEAGALGKIGYAAAGGSAEGALFGAGQGVSELALSTDPLTVERIAGTLSSNALFGAALGGPLGALGKGAELGLKRAKGAIDGALEKRTLKARNPEEAIESGDLGLLDKRTLDTLEKSELERITKERAPQRKALVDQLDEYRNANRDAHALREVAAGSADRDVIEAGASFARADIKLRQLLDDRLGMADDVAGHPDRVGRLLRQQRQSLAEISAWADDQKRLWQQDVANAPAEIRASLARVSEQPSLAARSKLAKELGLFDETGPFTEAGLDNATERVLKERAKYQWNGAITGGLKEPSIVKLQPEYQKVLEWNQGFQQQLDDIARPPTSDRLTKIAEARTILEAPKPPSLGGALLGAAAPFAGPLGVAAAAGNRVLGSFKKIADAATTRVGKAASSFLGIAGKAAEKATPYLPVLATKTLAAVRYAAEDDDDEPRPRRPEGAPKDPLLHELYERRSNEVKRQVHVAMDGSYQMRPAARQKMAAAFDGIRPADPLLADQLEEMAARRIEYLATIMPRLPDYGTIAVGPERRRVPELEMRAWARAAAALEDPLAVFDRASSATKDGKPVVGVTVEDAAAIRAVYPELLAEFTTAVAQQLPTLRKTLPYTRRLALSLLTGVPVDPAMTPGILRQLQRMHETEPGTAGGTQPAMAQAQFGSVSRKPETDSATPAQRRQQGAV